MEQRSKSIRHLNNSTTVGQEDNGFASDDLISALPDSILSIILSFLPTKDAIATSLLSKRWKFMWLTIHNLDFHHERSYGGFQTFSTQSDISKFVRYVDRVLLLHDGGFLNKFRLTLEPYTVSSSELNSWINIAITRSVSHLFLCLITKIVGFPVLEPFELPTRVFDCNSLRSLELNGVFSVSAAAPAVRLPNLTSLKLVSFLFQSEEGLEKLISGCPMLNDLYLYMEIDRMLHYFGKGYAFEYVISSTSLKRLELCFQIHYHLPEAPPNCILKLEASSLQHLRLVGFVPKIIVRKCLSSLVEVDYRLHLFDHEFSQSEKCNSVVDVVCAFDRAKTLFLSADAMRALNCAATCLLPEFKRLVKLEASTYRGDYSSLRDFIESSSNLEILKIYQRRNSLDGRGQSKWTNPVEVPKCISNSLKKVVVIKSSCGYEDDEREMIEFILKHGSVLEVMEIRLNSFKDCSKDTSLQEICHLPRMSPACEVKFS